MSFYFSATGCAIKYSNRDDFALIYSDTPCICSAVFTQNKVKAAPVLLSMQRKDKPIHAILVNSGNANACTGQLGMDNAEALTAHAAQLLNIHEESVLNASTGVIGVPLPVEKMKPAIPRLVQSLDTHNAGAFAAAIMTTDTIPKCITETFAARGKEYSITAISKGSGMIAPNMATLLNFVVSDAPVPRETLDAVFKEAVNKTLNSLTIDGDMSTNDSAFFLVPQAEKEAMLTLPEDIEAFRLAVLSVMKKTARLLIEDGEGVTKCVTVRVDGASTSEDAKKAARSIAESLLVKTALFGNDPNWGRIACAAGYSGAEFDPQLLSISIEGHKLFEKGSVCEYIKDDLLKIMAQGSYTIYVDLGAGKEGWEYLTSDISYEYVRINAEYTT